MDPMVWSFMVLSLVLSFLIPVHPSYHVYKEPGIRLVYGFSHQTTGTPSDIVGTAWMLVLSYHKRGSTLWGGLLKEMCHLPVRMLWRHWRHFQSDQAAADMPPPTRVVSYTGAEWTSLRQWNAERTPNTRSVASLHSSRQDLVRTW